MARTPLKKTQPPTGPRGPVEQQVEAPQKQSRRGEPSRPLEPEVKAETPGERRGRHAGAESRVQSGPGRDADRVAPPGGEAATGSKLAPGVTFCEVASSSVFVVGLPCHRQARAGAFDNAFVWLVPEADTLEEDIRNAESELHTRARTVRVERPNLQRAVLDAGDEQEPAQVKVGLRDAVEAVIARVPSEMREPVRGVVENALAEEGV